MLPAQRKHTGLALILMGLACSAIPIERAHAETGGTWTLKNPIPGIRVEVAAVTVDGRLQTIGGSIKSVAGPYHDEYDPKTDTWRELAPMPKSLDHMAATAFDGKIYAFGGFPGGHDNTTVTNDAFEYDPASSAWRVLPSMKVARASAGAVAVDGKIHVIGGRGQDGLVKATHEVFDLKSGTWSEAAPMPKARVHMLVIAVDGKIHAIGGSLKGAAETTGEHEVYDPATDTWTSAPPMPTPRSGVAGAYYHGMILVLGGEPPDRTLADNEGFDLKANSWRTLAPMPDGRHGFSGVTIGDNAYFVGGSTTKDDSGESNQLLMFHLP